MTVFNNPLMQPLFDGPLDLVGDVHGEIDTLRSLIRHHGYDSDGCSLIARCSSLLDHSALMQSI